MLIEPNGKIGVVCAGDQIHADSQFSCWGMSVPQSSVEPEDLNEACHKIGEACKARGVVGYFSVDFVTFIHPKSVSYTNRFSYIDNITATKCKLITEGKK